MRGGWRGSAPGDSTPRTSGKIWEKVELAQKQRSLPLQCLFSLHPSPHGTIQTPHAPGCRLVVPLCFPGWNALLLPPPVHLPRHCLRFNLLRPFPGASVYYTMVHSLLCGDSVEAVSHLSQCPQSLMNGQMNEFVFFPGLLWGQAFCHHPLHLVASQ